MDGYNSTSSAPAEMFLQYVLLWELTYPFPKTLLSAENIHQTKITQTTTITLLPTRPPKKHIDHIASPFPPKQNMNPGCLNGNGWSFYVWRRLYARGGVGSVVV